MNLEAEMNVLDKDGNETDATVKVSARAFSDVLIVEVGDSGSNVVVYIEKQGARVGVYVGVDDTGRSDAMLSLRVDPSGDQPAELRYCDEACSVLSRRSA